MAISQLVSDRFSKGMPHFVTNACQFQLGFNWKLYAPPPIYKVNQRYAAFFKASRTIEALRNHLEISMVTLENVANKEKP